MDGYLELDKHQLEMRREMSRFNQCIFYSTCVMVASILLGLVILGCTIGSDATVLIKDGGESLEEIQQTMREVNEIIPNIKRMLLIVEQLCENKQFGIRCPEM